MKPDKSHPIAEKVRWKIIYNEMFEKKTIVRHVLRRLQLPVKRLRVKENEYIPDRTNVMDCIPQESDRGYIMTFSTSSSMSPSAYSSQVILD